MAVHQLYIKQKTFEPAELRIKSGDQVIFQLAGRDDESLKVWVATGEPLEGEDPVPEGRDERCAVDHGSARDVDEEESRVEVLRDTVRVSREQRGEESILRRLHGGRGGR